ncbi:MAG TPA: amidohydrolase family protein, partial [Acidimicrobiales bacterium]|nr:amidohydrolase family protein [Acidimicrobiales bacterium]
PSEYFARNCFVGVSFPSPAEAQAMRTVGLDRVMWGSDYPHLEGTAPFSREAVRRTFAGVPRKETEAMLGGNAARIYGFNIAALQPIADRVGPTVAEVDSGLDAVPEGAVSLAFQDRPPLNV